MESAKTFAEEFAARLDAGEFETTEKAEQALTEELGDTADRNWTDDDAIEILKEAREPNAAILELGTGAADFSARTFPWRELALPAFAAEVRYELSQLGVDLNNMVALPSTVDTPEMLARVHHAFLRTKHFEQCGENARFDTVYEHGQWWVQLHMNDSSGRTVTYSVVDAEGGDSVDGFDFKEVA